MFETIRNYEHKSFVALFIVYPIVSVRVIYCRKKENHWLCANTSNRFRVFFFISFWTLFTGAINSHMSYPNMFFHFMAEKFGDIFPVCENISCILLYVKSNFCIDFCSKCLFIMLSLLFKAKMLPFLRALHFQPTQKNPIRLVEKYFFENVYSVKCQYLWVADSMIT